MTTKDVRDILIRGTLLGLLTVPAFVACVNCGTTPTPVPSVDYEAACANLARIGCLDGAATNCAATLQQMATDRLTNLNVSCLTSAQTKSGAVACGGVVCP